MQIGGAAVAWLAAPSGEEGEQTFSKQRPWCVLRKMFDSKYIKKHNVLFSLIEIVLFYICKNDFSSQGNVRSDVITWLSDQKGKQESTRLATSDDDFTVLNLILFLIKVLANELPTKPLCPVKKIIYYQL